MKNILIYSLAILIVAFTYGCEMQDKPHIGTGPTNEKEASEMLILCEGLFNMNNSTLARYIFKSDSLQLTYFKDVNKRGLGDTANDMKRYGSKVYITVDVSSQVEVIDIKSGISIKQIALFDDNGVARQPRYIDFYEGKAYVSCFDGYVARIDTATLNIEAYVKCGKNPDGLCIANSKIYVSNSGGLDFPDYDSTVSVIDIRAFKEIKKINVMINPGALYADSQGDVYVVTRGDYSDKGYMLHRIDTQKDIVATSYKEINALNMSICNDTAYMYSYDFNSNDYWIKVFDCKNEKIIKEHFISDGTVMQTPFSITANPTNGDVYITEAYNYVTNGDILCFNRDGKLKYRLNEVGLNPNRIILL